MEYTPYGLVRASGGTLPTDHKFQGQQVQAGIGLWTQPDSVVPNPMDPLALNRESFVIDNPLRPIDLL